MVTMAGRGGWRRLPAAGHLAGALADAGVGAGAASGSVKLGDATTAAALDAADALARFRARYAVPPRDPAAADDESAERLVYLCGNSLGLQPKAVRAAVDADLDQWAAMGVEGHFDESRAECATPWWTIEDTVREQCARLLGATPAEVACCNSLTANLHILMCAFYRPTETRRVILLEGKAFPSDEYALQSQARLHGLKHEDVLVRVWPREGEVHLREEDVLAKIAELGETLAVVMMGALQYYTGQRFDLRAISDAAHAVGAVAGFDLAHAAGNVDLSLHDDGVDFACWCSYKYLNSGPGGMAGLFVHERWAKASLDELPRLAGWWGHRRSDRFDMGLEFVPQEGAYSFMLSNPNTLSMVALRTSLDVHDEAGMAALRAKSIRLTAYLEALLEEQIGSSRVHVLTPRDPARRGAMLSVVVKGRDAAAVQKALRARGAVVDSRKPDVIRVAPVPLYNTYEDCRLFVLMLKEELAKMEAAATADAPVHFGEWARVNAARLAPPVCNAMVYGAGDWLVMAVGGPNRRKDFHINEGEELFYQLKGDMVLQVLEHGARRDIPIREGEIFLLPARVPHSPQRGAHTIGLVAERKRLEGELDGLRFYGEGADATKVLYEEWWHCQDLGKELKPVIEAYFASEASKSGAAVPGKVLDVPPVAIDDAVDVAAPRSLAGCLDDARSTSAGRAPLFKGAEFQGRMVTRKAGGGETVSHAGETFIMQAAGSAAVGGVQMREGQLRLVPPATPYTVEPDSDTAVTLEFYMEATK